MKTMLAGVLAAMLVIACSGAPGASPGLPTGDLGDVALTQACDSSSEASLSGVSGQLRLVGPETDTQPIQDSIDTLIDNLEAANLSTDADTLRDVAITNLQQAESALADPATAQQVATTAAAALDNLQAMICV